MCLKIIKESEFTDNFKSKFTDNFKSELKICLSNKPLDLTKSLRDFRYSKLFENCYEEEINNQFSIGNRNIYKKIIRRKKFISLFDYCNHFYNNNKSSFDNKNLHHSFSSRFSPERKINLYDNYYNDYLIQLNNIEKIKIENETRKIKNLEKIERQLNKIKLEEKFEKWHVSELEKKIKIETNNNILIIENYYKKDLDLTKYLEKKKKIMIDGILKTVPYTDLCEIIIQNSNFINITNYYDGIILIKLFNCKNFERITPTQNKDLLKLYIDNNLIELI